MVSFLVSDCEKKGGLMLGEQGVRRWNGWGLAKLM